MKNSTDKAFLIYDALSDVKAEYISDAYIPIKKSKPVIKRAALVAAACVILAATVVLTYVLRTPQSISVERYLLEGYGIAADITENKMVCSPSTEANVNGNYIIHFEEERPGDKYLIGSAFFAKFLHDLLSCDIGALMMLFPEEVVAHTLAETRNSYEGSLTIPENRLEAYKLASDIAGFYLPFDSVDVEYNIVPRDITMEEFIEYESDYYCKLQDAEGFDLSLIEDVAYFDVYQASVTVNGGYKSVLIDDGERAYFAAYKYKGKWYFCFLGFTYDLSDFYDAYDQDKQKTLRGEITEICDDMAILGDAKYAAYIKDLPGAENLKVGDYVEMSCRDFSVFNFYRAPDRYCEEGSRNIAYLYKAYEYEIVEAPEEEIFGIS